MKISIEKAAKIAGAACAAAGVVALSGLVASGAAAGAVVKGFEAAKETMKKIIEDDPKVACTDTEEPAAAEPESEMQETTNV